MNYNFSQKRAWRRWAWNRILERTEKPRDAIVLFLAGENAHDIDVAVDRGFRRENMIAVENDKDVAESLRAKKILTIQGNLSSVLWSLKTKPIDVVMADMCCGFVEESASVARALSVNPVFYSSTICANLLRGRDSFSNEIRKAFMGNAKHRGNLFYWMYGARMNEIHINAGRPENEAFALTVAVMKQWAPADLHSYKSTSGQVFDSVVFRSPLTSDPEGKKNWAKMFENMTPLKQSQSVTRSCAAVFAHHTMRTAAQC